MTDLAWQPPDVLELDLGGPRRRHLAGGAWVDVQPGWCHDADGLFARLLAGTPWGPQRTVRMYDRTVPEPRLTHRWSLDDAPSELAAMARELSGRYGVAFTQVGANLYRDGADSVAWHGDRVARELPEAVVALVSLGAVRPFRLRPTGGGESVSLLPGPGDLLVMGGSCQRTWQHAVPKCHRVSGPRISVQFRHAYGH
ncbi:MULTISPECIES: alpha-ketoglutarate-dependent dioxygenase AlkB [unclassified Pseudonocardia]|jgi:alkylated DNA repair dioxygenase AlkB|uniref:alpha-ketoglutarate-dependent dioxygenase AlkB n=1 Tax=unclassified Pseudonocardia TaxID=2619320 RepID=UPI000968702C|nr:MULTISPECIES: alpha-ketoglutarate-dependent dioxygenase AlkB [unclassified Pseudonocardia]MBN9099197.1 alpha-ketoglutarate-dependent dioxygenase AlkB [Pseudonocardia sp.]OJY49578.1 MAG: alpha-ketoglutarate-dependent dioxygenase AlkB [Pseudonocardia sp. 73-21]